MSKDFYFRFLKKEKVSKDAYTFYFDIRGADFDFKAGQYIEMTLAIKNPDERGNSHPFTISSSPLKKDYMTITTRIIQSSFKKTLANLSTGEMVKISGPHGNFVLCEQEENQRIFMAGGIGITPSHSIISYIDEKKLNIPITLFVSFSTMEDVIFYDELMEVSKRNKNIKVIYTITRPEESREKWTGETGRISKDLIVKYTDNPLNSVYYVSGPPQMVEAMVSIAEELNVPKERIRKENFIGY